MFSIERLWIGGVWDLLSVGSRSDILRILYEFEKTGLPNKEYKIKMWKDGREDYVVVGYYYEDWATFIDHVSLLGMQS